MLPKKSVLIAVFFSILILVSISFPNMPVSFLRFYIPEVFCADAYGNQINYVEVYQYNGTAYNLIVNFTSDGQSTRIADNQAVKFHVGIQFNATLASSTSQAIDYTRVYMNISGGVWTNEELTNLSCVLNGNFYYLEEQGIWDTNLAEAGATYECSARYEGYY